MSAEQELYEYMGKLGLSPELKVELTIKILKYFNEMLEKGKDVEL